MCRTAGRNTTFEIDDSYNTVKAQEQLQCMKDICRWCQLGYPVERSKMGDWLHTVPTAPELCGCLAQKIRERVYSAS